ncbi:FAD-dependent thymidylate synthase [Brevibacillus borstelensis]|uniref:FAD-dependent thymidylate synthase n=1 Tax=Brevibacillus borstelensis TaxID=45462 RepID=UPI0030CD1635
MAETQMSVTLIAHTKLSEDFATQNEIDALRYNFTVNGKHLEATDGQIVALTAIRTCYSAGKPSEIFEKEGDKYFRQSASDGEDGTEADRLFRHITRSGHTSTLEHITYTFAIEGVSRALLAQLTRHRVGFSFSVQSQRYVRFGSDDKTGGFDYVVPPSVTEDKQVSEMLTAKDAFMQAMMFIQAAYDQLRAAGVPAEDARMVLPNAAATNLTMTANLRALLDFYGKRRKGRGAQWEIAELAEQLRAAVVAVDPWTEPYFDAV